MFKLLITWLNCDSLDWNCTSCLKASAKDAESWQGDEGKILCFPSFEFVLGLTFLSYRNSVLLKGKLKVNCDRGACLIVPVWGENKKHPSKLLAIRFHQVMNFWKKLSSTWSVQKLSEDAVWRCTKHVPALACCLKPMSISAAQALQDTPAGDSWAGCTCDCNSSGHCGTSHPYLEREDYCFGVLPCAACCPSCNKGRKQRAAGEHRLS